MLVLIGLSTVLTVYVGGKQAIAGEISTGNIAEFIIYINMLTWPVAALGWITSIIQRASASQTRINEFLDTVPEIQNTATTNVPIRGTIAFEHVGFVYPDSGTRALDDVSFEVKTGESLAILGRTGSGKSSIAALLTRAYDATSGVVKLDGVPIRELHLDAVRSGMGYVPQDVFLFSDTIANNIGFGLHQFDNEQVETAAIRAHINTEIQQFPEQFQTLVGERGVMLSGGQKQRVSIARALIKNSQILIFDDCLSAVDAKTEQLILNNLAEVLKDKTAIIITHRIFSLLAFDLVIVIDDGSIIEQGTHDDLVKKNGYYAELYRKQQASSIEKTA
jgi:ATP-binding cassette subfamily B protein